MASELGVSTLIIATGVDRVMINFKKPNAIALDRLTVSEAKRHMADGQFPPGTLGPKIEAALDFLARAKDPGARVIITDLEHMTDALAGKAGTVVVRD